jgi:hypothetical protein
MSLVFLVIANSDKNHRDSGVTMDGVLEIEILNIWYCLGFRN